MAEERYVGAELFGEFVKRMDERFAHANELADQRYDSINQRFDEAEKAREQNHVHVNQRFDDMKESVNQRFDEMNRRISLLVVIASLLVLAFVGLAVALLQMAFGKS